MYRRDFIKTATALAFLTSLGKAPSFADSPGGIPRRVLGHTGASVSMLGIGGAHIAQDGMSEALGIQIVRSALDAGVNFLDNCWDYNKGQSEIRMGQALRDGYRDKAFLMTKTDGRDAKTATDQIHESLQRLQTDHVDLIQMHDIHDMAEPDKVFGPGGAVEALVAARQAGKVRYIGFTGHKNPDVHLHMLAVADQHGFLFDTVQMPQNLLDAHYDSFGQKVLPVLLKKDIGVLAMKPISAGDILKTNTVSAVDCLNFTMNLPVSVCITGCNSTPILNQALDVARKFKPLSEQQVASLLARTEAVAANGEFETYKFAKY
jgi:predicted aldo/keto reductase-like oxidoreductase